MHKLSGLKIKEVRGLRESTVYGKLSSRKKNFSPVFILFNDKKTYIELEKQDVYTYHDCSSLAREIVVIRDKKRWKTIYEDRFMHPVADMNFYGW